VCCRTQIASAAPRISSARSSCYKFEISKIIEQWLLFEYLGLEFTPLYEQAEKAREKYPERLRQRIGVGVIRTKNSCIPLS